MTSKSKLRDLLREARDLLDHNRAESRHVRMSDGTFPYCAACALEQRIDEALDD